MRWFLRMAVVAAVGFGSGCQWMKAERSSTVHTTCPGLSRPAATPVITHSTKCDFPSRPVEKVIIPPPEDLGITLK